MRALRVVLTAPAFDEDLGFVQRIEEFHVQQLIPQLSIKGLDIPILPRTPWLDVQRRDGQHAMPGPQGPSDKFRAVVRSEYASDSLDAETTYSRPPAPPAT
jgi:hypothetical protein